MSADRLSDLPEEARGWGEPVHLQSSSGLIGGFCWATGIMGVLAGCIILVLAFINPPKPGSAIPYAGVLVMGGAIALLGVTPLVIWHYIGGLTVGLFQEGIAVSKRAEHTTVRWPEVKEYRNQGNAIRLDLRDGRKVRISLKSFGEFATVKQKTEELVTAHLLPEAIQRLDAGEVIPFGREVGVSKDALHFRGEVVPWGHIKQVNLTQILPANLHVVQFKREGEWFGFCKLEEWKTPNWKLLLILAGRARGTGGEAPSS
jgi:hypothetical protein